MEKLKPNFTDDYREISSDTYACTPQQRDQYIKELQEEIGKKITINAMQEAARQTENDKRKPVIYRVCLN